MLNHMRFSQKEIGEMENFTYKITTKTEQMSFSIKTLGVWDFIEFNKLLKYIFSF